MLFKLTHLQKTVCINVFSCLLNKSIIKQLWWLEKQEIPQFWLSWKSRNCIISSLNFRVLIKTEIASSSPSSLLPLGVRVGQEQVAYDQLDAVLLFRIFRNQHWKSRTGEKLVEKFKIRFCFKIVDQSQILFHSSKTETKKSLQLQNLWFLWNIFALLKKR